MTCPPAAIASCATGYGLMAALCVKRRSFRRGGGQNLSVEDGGEASFECSAGFSGSFSFVDFLQVVDSAWSEVAALTDSYGVQQGYIRMTAFAQGSSGAEHRRCADLVVECAAGSPY